MEHFFGALSLVSFEVQRRNLLAGVFALLRTFGYNDLSNEVLTQFLLSSDKTSQLTSTEIYSSGLYNIFTQPVDSIVPNAKCN